MMTERHVLHRSFATGKWCDQCYGIVVVNRLLADAPHCEPLRKRLTLQIDNGVYTCTSFANRGTYYRALTALRTVTTITHAWVDNLKMPMQRREMLRSELVACGLLEFREPQTKRQKEQILLPIDLSGCIHNVRLCRICFAERLLSAGFAAYPQYAALQNRYVERLKTGYYKPSYFRVHHNRFWLLIRELGGVPLEIIEEWLASHRPAVMISQLREELLTSGYLTNQDHEQTTRFKLWFPQFLASQSLNEVERNILDRYCRLSLMKYTRTFAPRSANNGNRVGLDTRSRLRTAAALTIYLRSQKRCLRDFSASDVAGFPLTNLTAVRLFLIWLRKNQLTDSDWLPENRRKPRQYFGVGVRAVREMLRRLLDDSDIALDLRVAALLGYFGFRLTSLVKLRASDVSSDGALTFCGSRFPLEPEVAELIVRLRCQRLEDAIRWHDEGWDPWLFGHPRTYAMPSSAWLGQRLRVVGIYLNRMRADGWYAASSIPIANYVAQRAMGRTAWSPAQHMRSFSAKAGNYASMIASERLRTDQEI